MLCTQNENFKVQSLKTLQQYPDSKFIKKDHYSFIFNQERWFFDCFDCLLTTIWPDNFNFLSVVEISSINFLSPSVLIEVFVQSKWTIPLHLDKCCKPWLLINLQLDKSKIDKFSNEVSWARPASVTFQHLN